MPDVFHSYWSSFCSVLVYNLLVNTFSNVSASAKDDEKADQEMRTISGKLNFITFQWSFQRKRMREFQYGVPQGSCHQDYHV